MLTLWAIVVPIALVALAVGVWLLLRDTAPPSTPGRHRRPLRDPHDQRIVRDDEEPPEQPKTKQRHKRRPVREGFSGASFLAR